MTDETGSTEEPNGLAADDAKLVTLARGARGRVAAPEGAAVRDATGRTYASASVSLFSLHLSALQAAVAQAAASGARGIETAVLVVDNGVADAEGVSAVRDLGGVGVPVLVVDAAGTVTSTTHT